MPENRQAINPIWPGWFARFICRKAGHYPWSKARTVCIRCGIKIKPHDKIQKGQSDARE